MKTSNITAIFYALAAALFYAVNIPCSKLLLSNTEPTMTAAFLYLGAGFGVGIMHMFHFSKDEERLNKNDLPYTVGMILLDIIAPILLMLGVSIGNSSSASLIGNFEIAATTLIALVIFKEKVSKRLWTAIFFITASSIILSFDGTGSLKFSFGSLLVLGAAVCWGLENNCTRNISGKSTYQIVTIKGIFSGTGSLIIALASGESFPEIKYILLSLFLGFISYGLSIFTYIRAQKTLGAAKTSAYYAVAPFIGVFLSFVLLREPLSAGYIIALIIMLAGTAIVIYDTLLHSHSHEHTHIIKHTHGGTVHEHIITHSHEHNHYINDSVHNHLHKAK